MENYYHILGVSDSANFNEIKEAYRKMVKELHPDKENGNEELFKQVKEAYDVLQDAETRKMYDDLLFKNTNPIPPHPNQGVPSNTDIKIAVINYKRKSPGLMILASLTINVALVLAGMWGKRK